MAGKSQHIDELLLDVEWNGADRLSAVDQESHAALAGDLPDLGDRLNRAQDVAAMGHRNEAGIGFDGLAEVFGVDHAGVGRKADAREFNETGISHGLERARDRIMFERGRDDVIALAQQTLHGDVEGVGAVHGEDQAVEVRAANKIGERLADAIEHLFGAHGHAMPGAAGIGGFLG